MECSFTFKNIDNQLKQENMVITEEKIEEMVYSLGEALKTMEAMESGKKIDWDSDSVLFIEFNSQITVTSGDLVVVNMQNNWYFSYAGE